MKKPGSSAKSSALKAHKTKTADPKKKQSRLNTGDRYYFQKNKATNQLPSEPKETVFLLFHKPFQVLCQFGISENKKTLADWISIPEVYPAGRLDFDSEGLLILTNNGYLQHRIAHPDHKLEKTYAVQVEGIPTAQQLAELARGVRLKDGLTKPAKVKILENQSIFPDRVPPVRFRRNIPDTWIEIKITEGKNRQVRRMTAAVGLPTLRLIRTGIGHFQLDIMQPGEFKQVIPEGL